MSNIEEAQEFFSRKYTFMGDELAKHIMTILKELDNKNKDIESWKKYSDELEEEKLQLSNELFNKNAVIERQEKEIEQSNSFSAKWFKRLQEKRKEYEKSKIKSDKAIDKLITALAEERGTDEEEVREVFLNEQY